MSRKDVKNRRQEKMNHILKTATEVFAEKGYAGASTNEIADLAGISKRSMYYYMGDKDTLYASVISDMINEAYKLLDVSISDNLTPEQKLRQFIHTVAQIGNNRNLHSIVLRELLSGGESLPKDITDGLDKMFISFSDILEEGRKENGFRDVNPVIACLMLFSFFIYWDLVTPILARAGKRTEEIAPFGTDVTDSLIDEVQRMFVQFLKEK